MSASLVRSSLIGAHADYNRSDYVFPRTQSLALRRATWAKRDRPIRGLGEAMILGLALLAIGVATTFAT